MGNYNLVITAYVSQATPTQTTVPQLQLDTSLSASNPNFEVMPTYPPGIVRIPLRLLSIIWVSPHIPAKKLRRGTTPVVESNLACARWDYGSGMRVCSTVVCQPTLISSHVLSNETNIRSAQWRKKCNKRWTALEFSVLSARSNPRNSYARMHCCTHGLLGNVSTQWQGTHYTKYSLPYPISSSKLPYSRDLWCPPGIQDDWSTYYRKARDYSFDGIPKILCLITVILPCRGISQYLP